MPLRTRLLVRRGIGNMARLNGGGASFTVIDTGGYATGTDDVFEGVIRDQVEISMEEAGVIMFLVDAQTGITDLDLEIVQMVRKSWKAGYVDRQQD